MDPARRVPPSPPSSFARRRRPSRRTLSETPPQNETPKLDLGRSEAQLRRAEAEQWKLWEESRLASEKIQEKEKKRIATRHEPKIVGDKEDSKLFEDLFSRKEEKTLTTPLAAAAKVSELVTRAGAAWHDTKNNQVGGLDDVLAQVKRRVWTPLAAPPQLLRELGIRPVRGLLLYGRPGCGKSLVARILGKILSPLR